MAAKIQELLWKCNVLFVLNYCIQLTQKYLCLILYELCFDEIQLYTQSRNMDGSLNDSTEVHYSDTHRILLPY